MVQPLLFSNLEAGVENLRPGFVAEDKEMIEHFLILNNFNIRSRSKSVIRSQVKIKMSI